MYRFTLATALTFPIMQWEGYITVRVTGKRLVATREDVRQELVLVHSLNVNLLFYRISYHSL